MAEAAKGRGGDKPAEAGLLRLPGREPIPYSVVRSARRRRSYGFVVDGKGTVVFRAARWVKVEELLAFAARRHRFIDARLRELAEADSLKASKAQKKADLAGRWEELPVAWFRKAAKVVLAKDVAAWAPRVGVDYRQVRITSGRSVWGSCNARGDINLSWRLLLVPMELRIYVVVHELCHRVHMNHGARFWRLVEKHIPDYKEKRRALNRLGGTLD